ncbi:MAG: DNA-directed RNA polymerase specialized sigma24 family protein [Polyangiales bacterium]|jgi:DNA-directed RNA polymerase specialized sigma24 family protein
MTTQTEEAASFIAAVRPLVPDLLASATHHIRYHQALGDLVDELSPEELVGETLVRASHRGARTPHGVSLRSWLLTLETRTMDALIARSTNERKLWSFSLDEPIPPPTATEFDDGFWDWFQPDEGAPVMADEVADPKTVSAEAQQAFKDETCWLANLETPTWRAWLLHEGYGVSLGDVTSSLRLGQNETRQKISAAWSAYRQSLAN